MKTDQQPTDEEVLERTTRGWLRPYLIVLDEMFSRRWDYWLRTADAGRVLDEPIPQVEWRGCHDEPRKNIQACIEYCSNRSAWNSFNLFVEWLLFGFGDPSIKEPCKVEPDVNAFWYKTFNLGLLLKHPHDYLGDYAAELYGGGKHNPTAYFPTPMNVSVMMAMMVLSEKDKTASVCDPCVGSGRLLMAASNYSLNLYGVDIDLNILKVCRANMWVYVPWCAFRPEIEDLKPAEPMKAEGSSVVHPIQETTPEIQRKLLEFAEQMDMFSVAGKR